MVFSLQTVSSHITHIDSLEHNFLEWLQGRGQHTKEEVPVCSRPASQTSGPLRSSAVETNGSVHPPNGYLLHKFDTLVILPGNWIPLTGIVSPWKWNG